MCQRLLFFFGGAASCHWKSPGHRSVGKCFCTVLPLASCSVSYLFLLWAGNKVKEWGSGEWYSVIQWWDVKMISNLMWRGDDGESKRHKCGSQRKQSKPKEQRKESKGNRAKGKWRRQRREPQGRDSTLPSVGLMAPGKLSHGSVHVGQGWGAKTASMPFSWGRYTHTHT